MPFSDPAVVIHVANSCSCSCGMKCCVTVSDQKVSGFKSCIFFKCYKNIILAAFKVFFCCSSLKADCCYFFVCRPPVAWSAFTLNELSGLIPVLDHSILQKIPKVCYS